jgi:hypothetical protein
MVDSILDSDAGGRDAPAETEIEHRKDAIIFIPGLSQEYLDQSVDCISRKIVNALDRHTTDADATYLARDPTEEEYKEVLKTRRRTVVRRDLGNESPFLDIYEFDYEDELTKRCKDKKPISQAIVLLITLASTITKLPLLLKGQGKSSQEKFQILYSIAIVFIIASYTIILLIAAISSARVFVGNDGDQKKMVVSASKDVSTESKKSPLQSTKPEIEKQAESKVPETPFPNSPNSMWDSLMGFLRKLIVLFTGLGLFTSKHLKDFIKSAAIDYSCAIDYLSLGERRRAILGKLSLLVEHISEMSLKYERIHIVSYSFGSLVALDALYPTDEYCRRYDSVASLVTIGCPYDLVRTCWPDYFTRRINPQGVDRTWLNMYNPVDALGSNFRDNPMVESAQKGIELESGNGKTMLLPQNVVLGQDLHLNGLSLMNLLALRGLKVHSSYWDPDDKAEICCFDEIIRRLYPNL